MRSASEKSQGVKWALDTETVRGKAVLVAVAGPGGNSASLLFPSSFREILSWAASYADAFMCYNMDYDARALFKFLPESVWSALYRYESSEYRGLTLHYLPAKEFTARMGRRGPSIRLYDCAQHFQKSLRQACIDTLGEDVKDVIPKSWYRDMRAPLRDPARRAKVVAYCLKDAEATRRLWARLDSQYRNLRVPPRALARPLSPGQIAAGFFGDKIRFTLSADENQTARRAYRGGRIEVYRRGWFPRVDVYDLKSAYPWALSTLPDPRGAEVVETGIDEEPFDALYSVYCVRVRIPETCLIPPLPKFVDGPGGSVLVYPAGSFKAWVTGPELDVLKREGWLDSIRYGLHLDGERRKWLTEIPALFRLRASHPEISQAIKLVLNSIYGKLAQMRDTLQDANTIDSGTRRYGGEWVSTVRRPGATTNFFVASYVTARVRLKLWETMRRVGYENVCLAATDGLVLLRSLPRDEVGQGRLGDWVHTARASALIVGTGVYSLRHENEWHDKVRGYRPVRPLAQMLQTSRTRIQIKNRVAYTLGDYALRGAELNDIVEISRTLDVNFDVKREWPRPWKSARELLQKSQGSLPRIYLEA